MSKIFKQSYYENRKFRVGHNPSVRARVVKDAVKEILEVATKTIRVPVESMTVLDVGSGTGEYSFELEKYVKKVVGVEPYTEAYKGAIKSAKKAHSKAKFYNTFVEDFESSEKFDLVLSLTTIEHMPNAHKSFKRILELTKKGGMIYVTAPNKLWPYEHHYDLFFLSWLPLPLANHYVRIFRRGDSYEDSSYSRTYFGMKKLFDALDCTYTFSLPSDPNSSYLGCGTGSTLYGFLKGLGFFLIKRFPIFWIFSKGFIMIVRKGS